MSLSKYNVYLMAQTDIDITKRRAALFDLTAVAAGVMSGKGLKEYVEDNLTPKG